MTSMEAMMPLLAQSFVDSKTGIHFSPVPSSTSQPVRSSPRRRKVDAIADPRKEDISSISDEVLAARFKFRTEIGFGNWGSVWLCQKKDETADSVSIKLVHRSKSPTSSARVRSLWQEYKCIRALRVTPHPNLITFHSFIITPSYALITMDHHPRCIPVALPEQIAVTYFLHLCSAVDWLHAHGYTHNDIKPANILLSANDQPILIDFGFAQSHPVSEGAQRFVTSLSWGTPEYLDPSRAKGVPHDERKSDQFALGVTMYEVVVGRTPFEQDESEEFLTRENLEVYYRRTLTGRFFGDYKISAEFDSLIRIMVDPEATKRFERCGDALLHPFFSPSATPITTPVRSVKKKKAKTDENSPIEVHQDANLTPTGARATPQRNTFSPRPLVLSERNGVAVTPTRLDAPSKVLSPIKTPPPSRIPVRKVDISTPTALSPVFTAKSGLRSKHTLHKMASDRVFPPPLPISKAELRSADEQRQVEVLASSDDPSLGQMESSSDAAEPRSFSPADSSSFTAPSPTASVNDGRESLELQQRNGVMESKRWDVAGLQGRVSPLSMDSKAASGSLTSKLRKMSVRKAAPSFFTRSSRKSTPAAGGRPRAVTLSSRPTQLVHDERDSLTLPIKLVNKTPADIEAEKARLESFSRHIQDLIARKGSQPPLPRRSVASKLTNEDVTITDMSILSATEVIEFRAQVARELEQKQEGRTPEALKPRPVRSAALPRRAGASTSHSERPSTKIRPSLAPSFVGQGSAQSSPPSQPKAEAEVSFKRGHRRIPTAIRDVPPIFLTETESESDSDYRADTPCSEHSERPLSPPYLLQDGRTLPVWVPRSAESSSDHSDDDADLDEPTVTIRTPPRPRKPSKLSKHSPRKSPTSRPILQPSAETLYNDYTANSFSINKSPCIIEPVKFTSADHDADSPSRSHSRASTWASGKSHSRSRSVLSFIFSGSSSRASTHSMSVESFSAMEMTDEEVVPRKKGAGRFKRAVKKLLR